MKKHETIEQRWNRRRDVQFGVSLASRGHRPQQVMCRDIGIGGMYVEIDGGAISIDEEVHVSFRLGRGEARTDQRLPARVIRLTGNGAGLMFTDFPFDTPRALRQLIDDNEAVASNVRD